MGAGEVGAMAGTAAAVQQLMAAAVQSGRRSLDAATAAMKRLENPAISNARWVVGMPRWVNERGSRGGPGEHACCEPRIALCSARCCAASCLLLHACCLPPAA
jgi:hypothetical protein